MLGRIVYVYFTPLSVLHATRVIAAARRLNPREKNKNRVAVGKTGWLLRRVGILNAFRYSDQKRGERKKNSDHIGHGCCGTRARLGFKLVRVLLQRLRHTCVPHILNSQILLYDIIRSDAPAAVATVASSRRALAY